MVKPWWNLPQKLLAAQDRSAPEKQRESESNSAPKPLLWLKTPKLLLLGKKNTLLPELFENVQKNLPQGSGMFESVYRNVQRAAVLHGLKLSKAKSWNLSSSKLSNSILKRLVLSSKKKRQKIAEIPPLPPRPSPVEEKLGYLNFLRLQIPYYAFRNFWNPTPFVTDLKINKQKILGRSRKMANLLGGFNPEWKILYESNWIISPNFGVKIKDIWVATTQQIFGPSSHPPPPESRKPHRPGFEDGSQRHFHPIPVSNGESWGSREWTGKKPLKFITDFQSIDMVFLPLTEKKGLWKGKSSSILNWKKTPFFGRGFHMNFYSGESLLFVCWFGIAKVLLPSKMSFHSWTVGLAPRKEPQISSQLVLYNPGKTQENDFWG